MIRGMNGTCLKEVLSLLLREDWTGRSRYSTSAPGGHGQGNRIPPATGALLIVVKGCGRGMPRDVPPGRFGAHLQEVKIFFVHFNSSLLGSPSWRS